MISYCLCSSGNFSPFPSYMAGNALVIIFENSSSCIFQFQNLSFYRFPEDTPLNNMLILVGFTKYWETLRRSSSLVHRLAHFSVFSLPSLPVIRITSLLSWQPFSLPVTESRFFLIFLLLCSWRASWNPCPITTNLPLLEWLKHFLSKRKSLPNGYYYNSYSNTYLKIDFHNMFLLFQIV